MTQARRYYDLHSRDYVDKWRAMHSNTFTLRHHLRRQLVRQVIALSDIHPGHKVLELGCGTGLVLRELLKVTPQVFGTDTSREMIARVQDHTLKDRRTVLVDHFPPPRRFAHAEVLLTVDDLAQSTLPPETFDRLLSIEVLRYVEDLNLVFARVAALMKRESLFVFTLTNLLSASLFPAAYRLRRRLGRVDPDKELLQYFRREQPIFASLRWAGLAVVEWAKANLLSATPWAPLLIRSERSAMAVERIDRILCRIPGVGRFHDTFIIACKRR